MNKVLLFAMVFSLMVVSGFSQPVDTPANDNQPNGDVPKFEGKPTTAPGKGLSGILPGNASPVAKNVLNTVDKFIADPGKSLGNALSSLLGNGQASDIANQTSK